MNKSQPNLYTTKQIAIMNLKPIILTALLLHFVHLSFTQTEMAPEINNILKVEMNLSAMGVESDDFPSIDAILDFRENTSRCVKSFYNPAYEGSVYSLTDSEMESVKTLLELADLEALKEEYTIPYSDQPTSIIKIYTIEKTYLIKDYGLKGEKLLTKLYELVYRIHE